MSDSTTHTWLHHPETGGVWQCPNDVVDAFVEQRGWKRTDAPDTSMDGLFDESSAEGQEQTGFDPSEHTAVEVNAYLDQHRDSAPGEVERVLELERSGKNRTTITGD